MGKPIDAAARGQAGRAGQFGVECGIGEEKAD